MRERLARFYNRVNLPVVSIHAPVRERRDFKLQDFVDSKVSIHAPVRERRRNKKSGLPHSGFNSRSRKGATTPVKQEYFEGAVSIHAYLKSGSAAHIFYNAVRQMPASRISTRSVRLSARRPQTRKTDSTHNFLSSGVFFAYAVIVHDKVYVFITAAGQVYQNRFAFVLCGVLKRMGHRVGAFERGNNTFKAR